MISNEVAQWLKTLSGDAFRLLQHTAVVLETKRWVFAPLNDNGRCFFSSAAGRIRLTVAQICFGFWYEYFPTSYQSALCCWHQLLHPKLYRKSYGTAFHAHRPSWRAWNILDYPGLTLSNWYCQQRLASQWCKSWHVMLLRDLPWQLIFPLVHRLV